VITLDFFDTDNSYHHFCPACREEIPSWLIRYESSAPCKEEECEGCDRKRWMGTPAILGTRDLESDDYRSDGTEIIIRSDN
jgi:hypothetical protein